MQGFLQFNIRYNDHWTQKTLEQHLDNLLSKMKLSCDFRIQYLRGGDCFLTKQTRLTDIVRQSVKRITNIMPALSTMGGTSDARFIKDYANVVEFGLVGKTIHQIDEHVAIEDIKNLTKIYEAIIASYFSSS